MESLGNKRAIAGNSTAATVGIPRVLLDYIWKLFFGVTFTDWIDALIKSVL